MGQKKIEIVESSLFALNGRTISILRGMTLDTPSSMMQKALKFHRFDPNVKVAIAKIDGKYVGWALVKRYWNDRSFVMVFVRPEHRRKGIGKTLIAHFRKRGVRFCYRWDDLSTAFYNSVGLSNVFV